MSNILTGAFTRFIQAIRAYAGAISPAGAINRLIAVTKTYGGSITSSGVVTSVRAGSQLFRDRTVSGILYLKSALFSGWLYGTVSRILHISRQAVGAVSMAGDVVTDRGQHWQKAIAGAITSAGVAVYNVAVINVKSGVLSLSGIIRKAKELGRTKTGQLNATGRSIRRNAIVTKLYTGTLTTAGAIYKGLFRTYSGTLEISGNLTRQFALLTQGAVDGSLNLVGTVSRHIAVNRVTRGVIRQAGYRFDEAVEGIVNLVGTVAAYKRLGEDAFASGALEIYGRVSRIDAIIRRFSDAAISPLGAFTRYIVAARRKTGVINIHGGVTAITYLKETIRDGSMSITGAVSYAISGFRFYTATGVLGAVRDDLAGAVSRIINLLRTYSGTLASSGEYQRALVMARLREGALSFAGVVSGLFLSGETRIGTLSLAGNVYRLGVVNIPPFGGGMSFGGVVVRSIVAERNFGGDLNMKGGQIKDKEKLYFGPPNP